jgi:hypothetical protein
LRINALVIIPSSGKRGQVVADVYVTRRRTVKDKFGVSRAAAGFDLTFLLPLTRILQKDLRREATIKRDGFLLRE